MRATIETRTRTIDGLTIRYAESKGGSADALLLSPWSERLFAFEPTWSRLAEQARLVKDAAFRIGREAIVNVVKHAKARRLEIEIEFAATGIRLEVRDDGRGFSPEQGEEARRRSSHAHSQLTNPSPFRISAVARGAPARSLPGDRGGTRIALP